MAHTAKDIHRSNQGPFEGNASNKRFWALSDPPRGKGCGGWMWFTREMLQSPAWRSLTYDGRRVLDCIVIEHLKQKRVKNGELVVPYSDFVAAGIYRKNVKAGIDNAVMSGFLDVASGRRSYGAQQLPNFYTLTWLPTCDGGEPTNRWKAFKDFPPVPSQGTRQKSRIGRILRKSRVPSQGIQPGSLPGNSVKGQNGRKPPKPPSSLPGNCSTISPGEGERSAPAGSAVASSPSVASTSSVDPSAPHVASISERKGALQDHSALARREKSRSARRGAA